MTGYQQPTDAFTLDDLQQSAEALEFLFGDAAETAQRGASTRLKRWSQAFDEWLAVY